jgi:hypothetical protein
MATVWQIAPSRWAWHVAAVICCLQARRALGSLCSSNWLPK